MSIQLKSVKDQEKHLSLMFFLKLMGENKNILFKNRAVNYLALKKNVTVNSKNQILLSGLMMPLNFNTSTGLLNANYMSLRLMYKENVM